MRRYFKIIDRYIFLEIFTPFWVSLFVFTGVLFLARSLKLIDLVMNKNVPVTDIVLLFSFLIPGFLELAIPMALLLSVIIAFGRLSSDSELVVMRSLGLNLRRLAAPVFSFAVACFLLTATLSLWLRPWSNHQLAVGLFEIAKNQASAGLTQGVFNELGQLTIYAEEIKNRGESLKKVIISDRRIATQPRTFIAKHGQLITDDDTRSIALQLYDGSIQDGSGLNYSITYFDINSITIEQDEMVNSVGDDGKQADEMFVGELITAVTTTDSAAIANDQKQMRRLNRQSAELHRRFVIPTACLCIALIAMALGVQPSRGAHTWGQTVSILAGILVIVVFYLLIALAKALGEQGILPIGPAMWLPNVVYFLLAGFLFRKMGSESWMAVSDALADALQRLVNSCKQVTHSK